MRIRPPTPKKKNSPRSSLVHKRNVRKANASRASSDGKGGGVRKKLVSFARPLVGRIHFDKNDPPCVVSRRRRGGCASRRTVGENQKICVFKE
jgi:hypothetical protein